MANYILHYIMGDGAFGPSLALAIVHGAEEGQMYFWMRVLHVQFLQAPSPCSRLGVRLESLHYAIRGICLEIIGRWKGSTAHVTKK